MEHTEYYHLPQWEDSDRIRRDDFNEAFDKIDAGMKDTADAAAGGIHLLTGTYHGNGADQQFIDLGVTPKAVIVMDGGYRINGINNTFYGGISVSGMTNHNTIRIAENGFYARGAGSNYIANSSALTYVYIALY